MAAKTCEICRTRPALTAAKSLKIFGVEFPYCYPCHELANWENTHSDYAHDADATEIVEENATTESEAGKRVQGCWVCFPELDQTREDYTARTGTSRQGMVITVPIRAAAKAKAKVAAEKLGASDARIATSKSTGDTTLKSNKLDTILVWDARGRFIAGSVGGRVVRNVSEAIRQTR